MRAVLIAALVAGSACASQQVQSPAPVQPAQVAFDPAGTWDFTTDVQGSSVRGVMVIRRNDQGALVGSITTDVTGEIPLQQITLEGRRAEARSTLPDGTLVMRMEFLEDDRLTGGWELSTGMSGAVTGQRRRTP
jgi:hypothetical protein